MRRNPWFKNKSFFAETIAVTAIDKKLAAAGHNPATQEYFRMLDAEIKTQMPDLSAKVSRVFKAPERIPANGVGSAAKSAVAPVSRAGGVSRNGAQAAAGKRRVILTKQDMENMQEFKLDPHNPEHQKEYWREECLIC